MSFVSEKAARSPLAQATALGGGGDFFNDDNNNTHITPSGRSCSFRHQQFFPQISFRLAQFYIGFQSFCATSRKGVALQWFDMAGRPGYVCCMFPGGSPMNDVAPSVDLCTALCFRFSEMFSAPGTEPTCYVQTHVFVTRVAATVTSPSIKGTMSGRASTNFRSSSSSNGSCKAWSLYYHSISVLSPIIGTELLLTKHGHCRNCIVAQNYFSPNTVPNNKNNNRRG